VFLSTCAVLVQFSSCTPFFLVSTLVYQRLYVCSFCFDITWNWLLFLLSAAGSVKAVACCCRVALIDVCWLLVGFVCEVCWFMLWVMSVMCVVSRAHSFPICHSHSTDKTESFANSIHHVHIGQLCASSVRYVPLHLRVSAACVKSYGYIVTKHKHNSKYNNHQLRTEQSMC